MWLIFLRTCVLQGNEISPPASVRRVGLVQFLLLVLAPHRRIALRDICDIGNNYRRYVAILARHFEELNLSLYLDPIEVAVIVERLRDDNPHFERYRDRIGSRSSSGETG